MSDQPTGPRGGSTTITAGGLLKKTVYFSSQEWQALRRRAYEEEKPITEIVRRCVSESLGLG